MEMPAPFWPKISNLIYVEKTQTITFSLPLPASVFNNGVSSSPMKEKTHIVMHNLSSEQTPTLYCYAQKKVLWEEHMILVLVAG